MPAKAIALENNAATLDKAEIQKTPVLPFETYSTEPDEYEVISDGRGTSIKIPRHGSLNFLEYNASQRLVLEVLKREDVEVTPDFEYEVERAALLLRLRFDLPKEMTTQYILKDPMGRPLTRQMISAINQFFDREEKGVVAELEAEAGSGGASKKGIDWAELYWQVQLFYPHEVQFNAKNFAKCPIHIIYQALRVAHDRDFNVYSHLATPISFLGADILGVWGGKAIKPHRFNPYGKAIYRKYAKETIDPSAARCFLRVYGTNGLPSWVMDLVDLDLIQASAGE